MLYPRARRGGALFLIAALVASANARAAADLDGIVIDAGTALPLAGASVSTAAGNTKTDARGHFHLHVPDRGAMTVSDRGYQSVTLNLDGTGPYTIALTAAHETPRVIAVTATRRSDALAQSTTFSRTVSSSDAIASGTVRLADALRQLPGVNNGIAGDTGALGDDINLSIRGIGTLETTAAIDGHPIAYGVKGGFNDQLSPAFPFRDVTVLYGSGGDLLGLSAIGGVVNFSTLDPTATPQASFSQGFGTFGRLATSMSATGTFGKLGYAFAYGTSGLDGPFHHDSFYQSGAAYDPSAPAGSNVYNLGIYEDDSGVASRAGLFKVRWGGARDNITLTSVASSYWENKTGNGDEDYLEYAPALAFATLQLTNKSSKDSCPGGTFTALGPVTGKPQGYGPGNVPDGGVTCQTPQQYAAFVTGWQGAGPAWQAFRLNDEHIAFRHSSSRAAFALDAYTTGYDDTVDRLNQLPFKNVFGDRGKDTYYVAQNAGALARETFTGRNNDVEAGYQYLNSAYVTASSKSSGRSQTNTYAHETSFVLRDAYHPVNAPLVAYFDAYARHASATGSNSLDGRLAVQLHTGTRDIVRVAMGTTTTQPSADMIGQPFVEGNFGLGGGTPVNCGGLNSIGSAPSSLVKPERGVDEEAAFAHAWNADNQVQLSLYNVRVYGKLYPTIVPLSATGTSFVDPAFLTGARSYIMAKCGAGTNADALIGTTGNFNVGTLSANGLDLAGRVRLDRTSYVSFDWALTSTTLAALDTATLQSNYSYIVGAQLPRLPLHTATLAYDRRIGALDARYVLHWVSINNTKALPAYDFSDLSFAAEATDAVHVTVSINNLFNQYASIAGLQYEGIPLPLNGYAPASAYAPYTGASATERFGLPSRSLYVNMEVRR